MNRFITAVFVSFLMLSCTHTDDIVNSNLTDEATTKDYVAFRAAMSPTRATETYFEDGDKISVFATNRLDEVLQSSNYADNCQYIFSSNEFIPATYSDGISYDKENSSLTFYAIYPYSKGYSSPKVSFSVMEDQREVTNYNLSNLMFARSEASDEANVELWFDHMMSKVVINLHCDNFPVGKQEACFANVHPSCDINLNTKESSPIGEATYLLPCNNGTNSFKILIPAQVIEVNTEFFYFSVGDESWVWAPTKTLTFEPGVEYTYDLYLN